MIHFTGDEEDFADIYRPYSQTPYTPEPGYLILAGEAGSPSSTGLTTSAFRLLGLKAEQFFSPIKGRRTGAVEIDEGWYYHDGNWPLTRNMVPVCLFFGTLDGVETGDSLGNSPLCGNIRIVSVGDSITGEITRANVDTFSVKLESGRTYRILGKGSVSGGGTLPRVAISICSDGEADFERCELISAETDGNVADPEIFFTPSDIATPYKSGYWLFVAGGGGATGTYTLELR